MLKAENHSEFSVKFDRIFEHESIPHNLQNDNVLKDQLRKHDPLRLDFSRCEF